MPGVVVATPLTAAEMVVVVVSVDEVGVDPAADDDELLELEDELLELDEELLDDELLDDLLDEELLELLDDELEDELLELLDDELEDELLELLDDEVPSAGHVPDSWNVTRVVVLSSSPTDATAYALSSSHPAGVFT